MKRSFQKWPKIGLEFSVGYRLNVLVYKYVRVFNKDLYLYIINTPPQYGPTMAAGYAAPGPLGVLWRCVLWPPLAVRGYAVRGEGCGGAFPVRTVEELGPRLCFRRAADKKVSCIFRKLDCSR